MASVYMACKALRGGRGRLCQAQWWWWCSAPNNLPGTSLFPTRRHPSSARLFSSTAATRTRDSSHAKASVPSKPRTAAASAADGWWFGDHADEIAAARNDSTRSRRIRNSGPQPKQRMMEKGFSYFQATLISNEVYRALVEGRSYDDGFQAAVNHPHFHQQKEE